jgi:nitrogen fixation protein FixH
MPLFGKDAKTYYSADLLDATNTAADATWVEVTNIQDLTDNFTAEEEDITTRATAALGWAATAVTIKNGEITFTVLMEDDDVFVQALMDAFLNSTPIAVLDMTGSKDVDGTFGLAANFSVSMTFEKPVKGTQKANVTLKVYSFPEWVEGAA